MSEQEQETPVWHAYVGDGWEPVLIGEPICSGEEVLVAAGWVPDYVSGFLCEPGSLPRRRRKRLYEIRTMIGGAQYSCIKRVKVGDCFRLIEGGVLIPIEVDE